MEHKFKVKINNYDEKNEDNWDVQHFKTYTRYVIVEAEHPDTILEGRELESMLREVDIAVENSLLNEWVIDIELIEQDN